MSASLSQELCKKGSFPHNQRTRYTDGFYCRDCCTFFPKESNTYRRYEYLGSLMFVVHNIGADFIRGNKPVPKEITTMEKLLTEGRFLSSKTAVDMLIKDALELIHKHGETDESATPTLS